MSSLRASFPEAKITWLVGSQFAALLEHTSNLDEVLLFDRKMLGKWWYYPKAFASLIRFISTLRRGKFDLVIDLQGLFRTALFSWLTGCKKRFGMKTAREYATVFYTDKIAQDADSVHVIDHYLKIVAAVGASSITTGFELAPTSQAASSVKKLLSKHNLNPGQYIVFVPGSTHASKCWPIERFAELAEKISSEFELSVVAVGTAGEKPGIQELISNTNVPIVDLAGLTDIPQLISLLKDARLVVSNDTGPGHIASALAVPVVLIFGPTNPARIRPYKKPDSVVAVDPEGRGYTINSSNPKYSITAITVDQVFQKVALQLKQSPARRPGQGN